MLSSVLNSLGLYSVLMKQEKYLCITDPRKLVYVVHITVLCRCYIMEKILQILEVCFWSLCIS